MKIMQLIISILVMLFLLCVFIYINFGVKITTKPFNIKVESWGIGFGYTFLVLAVIFLGVGYQKRGYDKGFDQGVEKATEEIKKIVSAASRDYQEELRERHERLVNTFQSQDTINHEERNS